MRMGKTSLGLLLLAASFFSGCDSSTTTTLSQQVLAVAWLPDESGMLALIYRATADESGASTASTSLYRIGTDGSIGERIAIPETEGYDGYQPLLFVSPDGRTAITRLGTFDKGSVYKIDLASGKATAIEPTTHLLGASPDGKYIVTTDYQPGNPSKPLRIYDITGAQPRSVLTSPPTLYGVQDQRVLWLDSGLLAVNHTDTVGNSFISIRDTNMVSHGSISYAGVPVSGGVYLVGSRTLYFVTSGKAIDTLNLSGGTRGVVLVNDSLESFDVTRDGRAVVYSRGSRAGAFELLVRNIATGKEQSITTDGNVPIISPRGNRVAYLGNGSSEIRVAALSVP